MSHRLLSLRAWCSCGAAMLLLGVFAGACSNKPPSAQPSAGASGASGFAGSAAGAAGGQAGTAAGAVGTAGTSAAAGTTAGTAGDTAAAGASAGSDAQAGSGGGDSGSGGAAGTNAGAGGSGSAGTGSDILAPAQGALLGHYYGDGTLAQTDARIGRQPALHLTYYAWDDDWPSDAANDFASGRIPLVNWEPDGIDFNDIVSGSLDATINARASGSKALGKKFFVDFAAEMNGDEAWSDNNATLYVNAYRHIHDLFVAAGASNVIWAWCPNVTDTDGGNSHTLDYYPGDAYVDWTGVDGYNWGAGGGFSWQSFHDVFADIYPILASKGKPILIGEMASDENGGDKAQWIASIVPALHDDFPLIKGLVWFDVHKERHWEINSSPTTLDAYKTFASDPFMNP